jgi:hypothetical protein
MSPVTPTLVLKPELLRAGDVLLYRPSSIFGWAIRIKTGSPCSHVEVAVGAGFSVASRDGIGVNRYPLRLDHLGWVLRPNVPFYLGPAMDWFDKHKGEPYGWLDLLDFFSATIDGPGMVCSPCATNFLRAGGVRVFGSFPAIRVSPRDFLTSEYLTDVTAMVTGSMATGAIAVDAKPVVAPLVAAVAAVPPAPTAA